MLWENYYLLWWNMVEDKYKPIVQYRPIEGCTDLKVGQRTYVIPLDHPSYLVINGGMCLVSNIKYISEDGYFETNNTRYVRVGD